MKDKKKFKRLAKKYKLKCKRLKKFLNEINWKCEFSNKKE